MAQCRHHEQGIQYAWITLFRYSIVVDVSKFLPNESLYLNLSSGSLFTTPLWAIEPVVYPDVVPRRGSFSPQTSPLINPATILSHASYNNVIINTFLFPITHRTDGNEIAKFRTEARYVGIFTRNMVYTKYHATQNCFSTPICNVIADDLPCSKTMIMTVQS